MRVLPVAAMPASLEPFLSPYRGLPPHAWIQAVAGLVNRAGGAAKMFLPLYLRETVGLSIEQVGWLLATYGAGLLLGAYLFGSLSDRLAPRRVMTLCFVGNGLSLLLLAGSWPVPLVAVWLVLSGLFEGGMRPVNQRLLLESCEPAIRPRAHGLYRVLINLGWAIGGLVSGLAAGWDYRAVFIGDGLATFLALAWFHYGYRRWPQPETAATATEVTAAPKDGGSPWRDPAFLLLMASCLALAMAYDQMYGMFGTFLREHYRLAPIWFGALFTLNGTLIVLCQGLVSNWVSRLGLWRAASWGTVLMTFCWLLLPLGQGATTAVLVMVLLTIGEMLHSPAEISLVMQLSEGRARGRYLGIYMAVWGGRTLIAPAVGAQLYSRFGPTTLWLACAGCGVLSLLLRRAVQRRVECDRSHQAG
ncbi:MFS transporter [Chitinimonas lacunae]|uniref:MFS transporter n=1 Tax=Chitinimonas lacunae TaxID=1963018 RepID=A0ABV8MTX9_9NEIS